MLLYVVCQLFSLVGLLALANVVNLVCYSSALFGSKQYKYVLFELSLDF